MFVLLRHAHAVAKQSWDGPDEERPLSPLGCDEALALVPRLAALSLVRLVSSPRLRCRQTLEPLSQHLGILMETSELLVPDGDPPGLARFVEDPASADAVFCTHGETLTALLSYWQQTRRVRLAVPTQRMGKGMTEKSGAWMITDQAGTLHARYLPPPAAPQEAVP